MKHLYIGSLKVLPLPTDRKEGKEAATEVIGAASTAVKGTLSVLAGIWDGVKDSLPKVEIKK